MIKKLLFHLNRFAYLFIMLSVVVLVVFFPDGDYRCRKTFRISNIEIVAGLAVAVAALLIFTYWRSCRKGKPLQPSVSDATYDAIAKYGSIALFLAEVYISYNIFFTNGWDAGNVWNTAAARSRGDLGWSLGISHYFSMYPNNLALLLLETWCLKVNGALGIFSESYNMMSAIVVDCLCISASCYLTYKVLTFYVRRPVAALGWVAVIILAGLSPWMSVCYSDSLGIVFPVLTFYLYAKPRKTQAGRLISQAFAVAVACIGYSLKPQCIIILIAIILIEVIKACSKDSWKGIFKVIGIAAVTLLCLSVHTNALQNQYESIGVELNPEQEFGMSHFLMMGMNDSAGGIYAQEDIDFSFSFATAQERSAANIRVVIERLKAMGVPGYLRLVKRKLLTAFHDGTFAWFVEGSFYIPVVDDVNTVAAPFLKSIFYESGRYYQYLSLTEQITWICVLVLALSAAFIAHRKYYEDLNILTLSIVGLTLFQVLFEVRSRYLFIYVPIFCVLATLGINNILESFRTYIDRRRK